MFIVEVYRMAMISTRGRYALRVMLDLAEHNTGEYITLMDIAQRQNISEKYLENIIAALSKMAFCRPCGAEAAAISWLAGRNYIQWEAFCR